VVADVAEGAGITAELTIVLIFVVFLELGLGFGLTKRCQGIVSVSLLCEH
jgi:hypothetical protein